MDEVFLEWPVDEAYLVSNFGRVFSVPAIKFLVLKIKPGGNYLTAQVRSGGRLHVATAVLELFVTPRPSWNHIPVYLDGDRFNCRVDNLAWGPRHSREQLTAMSRSRFV